MQDRMHYPLISSMLQKYVRMNPWTAMALYMSIIVLFAVFAVGTPSAHLRSAAITVALGTAFDYVLRRVHRTTPHGSPYSGFITSLILVILLPADLPLAAVLAAIALAIGSKYFLKIFDRHIFNPAAFGAAIVTLVFGTMLAWNADSFPWLVVLLGAGNAWRVRKTWQVGSFIAIYVTFLFVIGTIQHITFYTLYFVPWFFSLFMLTEPVTSPPHRRNGIFFGAAAGLMTIVFSYVPAFNTAALLWGLLAANLFRFVLPTRPNS